MAPSTSKAQPPRRSARLASKIALKPKPSPISSRALRVSPLRHNVGIVRKLPPKPPSICDFCWKGPFAAHLGLFHPPIQKNKRGYLDGGYSYFISESQMKHGIDAGCAWCSYLSEDLEFNFRRVGGWPKGLMRMRLGRYPDRHVLALVNNDREMYDTPIATSIDNPAAPHIVERDLIREVRSPRAMSLARAHLDECVEGHKDCNRISPPAAGPLPTRLVDCTYPDHPRLVETEGTHGVYLALSYAWGEPQPHQTTMCNVSSYGRRMDPSLLPRTIRDAIYVTRSLGFQYLWVDSLCIIQDFYKDKLHEISRMYLIYRRAYLTIIAATASRVSEGFLHDRPPLQEHVKIPFLCPPRLPLPGKNTMDVQQVGEVCLRKIFARYDYSFEPINRRGWCFQELYMSPRALIFGWDTFWFRCYAGMYKIGSRMPGMYNIGSRMPGIYSIGCGVPTLTVTNYAELLLPEVLLCEDAASPVQHGSKKWSEIHYHWLDIIFEYTGRTLGDPSDKLVACGAIAQAFQRVLRTDYLAGMWRDTLLQDLFWNRFDPGVYGYPTRYRAPSWSWASFDGRCFSDLDRDRIYGTSAKFIAIATVERCEVVLKNKELPFGEVTGGFLVLHGALIPCLEPFIYDLDRVSARRLPHAQRDQRSQVFEILESDHMAPGLTRSFRPDHRYNPNQVGLEWHLLPLLRHEGSERVEGLILELTNSFSGTHTQSGKVYRRAGIFTVEYLWGALKADRFPLVDVEII